MSLFGDKLLIRVDTNVSSKKEYKINIKRIDNSSQWIYPFSCISLIMNQLPFLIKEYQRRLCKSSLRFVDYPFSFITLDPSSVRGFRLDIFKKRSDYIYNQFYPKIFNAQFLNEILVQGEVVININNYQKALTKKISENDLDKLRVYLLIAITFFQQELLPLMKKYNMNDDKNMKNLIHDEVVFCSSIFNIWNNPLPFTPKSDLFNKHLKEAMDFSLYGFE